MKAFPSNGFYERTTGGEQPQKLEPIMGMDLRDYFASQIIAGFLANNKTDYYRNSGELMVKLAYEMADEMMKAREK